MSKLQYLKVEIGRKGYKKNESDIVKEYRDMTGEIDELYKFILISKCDECGENAIISGIIKTDRNYNPSFFDENGYNEDLEKNFVVIKDCCGVDYINHKYYVIENISPSPYLISIPKKLLQSNDKKLIKIKDYLLKSFGLFWNNKKSCANKLRIIVEQLMDYYEIDKKYINKEGEEKTHSLHAMILLYKHKTKKEEIVDKMLAIKWIGNEGSHSVDDFQNKDLITCYEILENILELEFNEIDLSINEKAKEIISRFNK